MTEDEKEDLLLRLLMEFQKTVGATTEEQDHAFFAGVNAALELRTNNPLTAPAEDGK